MKDKTKKPDSKPVRIDRDVLDYMAEKALPFETERQVLRRLVLGPQSGRMGFRRGNKRKGK